MVVGCRLGANLFPHCQMVKRVSERERERERKEGAKKGLLLSMMTPMRHMAEENSALWAIHL